MSNAPKLKAVKKSDPKDVRVDSARERLKAIQASLLSNNENLVRIQQQFGNLQQAQGQLLGQRTQLTGAYTELREMFGLEDEFPLSFGPSEPKSDAEPPPQETPGQDAGQECE